MLANAGSAGSGPAAGAPAAGGAPAAAEEKPKEEEKQEEKEDVDMGNLFGGDDEYYWASHQKNESFIK